MRLKTGEKFLGYALFEPDPTPNEENPGYFEYMDHYDQTANQYVPCAGEQCPFCRVNDNPSTRAMTVWYFPDNDKGDQIKVFTMNFSTTEDVADIAEEEDGILGKKFRVKRLSDKGEYRVRPMSDKKLSKTDLKKLFADANFPSLEEIVDRQLKAQWERLKAADLLDDTDDDDDDDDEVEETPKARKGKAAPEPDEDDDDETEDDDEDENDDEEEDDDSDDDDDDDEESEDEDDDEDEEEESSDDDDEEDDSEKLNGDFVVVSTDEANETVTVKVGKAEVEIWLSQGMEIDYDEVKKGTKLNVVAVQDDDGDFVASEISVVKSKGGKGKGKTKTKK
jgi:hypothetical protein